MPSKPAVARDLTPFGKLAESTLHQLLGYQLAQATITTNRVFNSQVGQAFELRPVEFTILTLVHDNPGVTAKQLARALALAPPKITVWMERLESRGLVARERSTSDGRSQHIRTTKAGATLARDAAKRVVEGESSVLASLSAAERAMLMELLHKVARARQEK
jgi:DNA-binding MarR family transcriptional regulator